MTDSATNPPPGKRQRLVASAVVLMHEHGVQAPTLAQIAEAADVPLGNVYYYFKTRDDLIQAVIDFHVQQVSELLAHLDELPTPRDRLKGLSANWSDSAELAAAHGCPLGQLAGDLTKQDPAKPDCAARLLGPIVDWAERQLGELGQPDPRTCAISFGAAIQGAAVLANSFNDAELLVREVGRINERVDSLT